MTIYLYAGNYDYKAPPKSWAKKPAAYYARRLAKKAKAVGSKSWQDYLKVRGLWLLVEVKRDTAAQARDSLERALSGSVLASTLVTVHADPFNLTKGTPLDPEDPLGPGRGPLFVDAPPKLKLVGPPEAKFTIGSTGEHGIVDREAGREIEGFDPQALFMGFYAQPGTDKLGEGLEGIRQGFEASYPFDLQRVSAQRKGYASQPKIIVTGLAKSPARGFSTQIARPLAVSFARANGLVFDLYYPSVGFRRDRISTDRNPQSKTYGKNKKMTEVEVTFDIPHEQFKRLPQEIRDGFSYSFSSSIPTWGRKEIDSWLGIDKVVPFRRPPR